VCSAAYLKKKFEEEKKGKSPTFVHVTDALYNSVLSREGRLLRHPSDVLWVRKTLGNPTIDPFRDRFITFLETKRQVKRPEVAKHIGTDLKVS
jgi:hypothetical protein